jgi:hypothetical protein
MWSFQILILADEALEDSVVKADSRSLATLLLIRDIQVRYFQSNSCETQWFLMWEAGWSFVQESQLSLCSSIHELYICYL